MYCNSCIINNNPKELSPASCHRSNSRITKRSPTLVLLKNISKSSITRDGYACTVEVLQKRMNKG